MDALVVWMAEHLSDAQITIGLRVSFAVFMVALIGLVYCVIRVFTD